MALLKILSGTIESGTKVVENYQAEHAPWSTPDLAAEVQILVWRVCVLSETIVCQANAYKFISLFNFY